MAHRHIFLAKLCEQAERYDDMVTHIREVASTSGKLSFEEQTLLSTAYGHVICARRVSLRNMLAINPSPTSRGYVCTIREELESICGEVLQLIDSGLLAMATSATSKVYYYKMYELSAHDLSVANISSFRKGDYNRYLAEYGSNEVRSAAITSAEEAYEVVLIHARRLFHISDDQRANTYRVIRPAWNLPKLSSMLRHQCG